MGSKRTAKWKNLTTSQIRKTIQYKNLPLGISKTSMSRQELLARIEAEFGSCYPDFVCGYSYKKAKKHYYPRKKSSRKSKNAWKCETKTKKRRELQRAEKKESGWKCNGNVCYKA